MEQRTRSSSTATPLESIEPTSAMIFIVLTGVEITRFAFIACVGSSVTTCRLLKFVVVLAWDEILNVPEYLFCDILSSRMFVWSTAERVI